MKAKFKSKKFGNAARTIALLLSFSVVGTTVATSSRPTTSNPLSYIAGLGQIGLGANGAAYLPASVLTTMASGKLSDPMMFTAINSLFTQLIEKEIRQSPGETEPFVPADQKTDASLCHLERGLVQVVMTMALPVLSNSATGARITAQEMQQLNAALKGSENCASVPSDGAIDDAVLSMLSR